MNRACMKWNEGMNRMNDPQGNVKVYAVSYLSAVLAIVLCV